MEADLTASSGHPVKLKCESNYPADGHIQWRIQSEEPVRIRFRIPSWAQGKVSVSGAGLPDSKPTAPWFTAEMKWSDASPLVFEIPMDLRVLKGEREQAGKVSLFRGPLLLAWDQQDNAMDEFRIPRIDPAALLASPVAHGQTPSLTSVDPWLLLEVAAPSGPLRLRDFATAGMSGTRYRSWLRTVAAGSDKKGGPPQLCADMTTSPVPESGGLLQSTAVTAEDKGVKLNGAASTLQYSLPEHFGEGDFTVAVRVKAESLPDKRIAQIFSAWCGPGDDPLRLVIQNGHVHARIENSGGSAGTGGVPFSTGTWHHLAAVKEGCVLTLFLDGNPCASAEAPATLKTKSRACALGANPLYTGSPEFLAGTFRHLAVYPRALADEEIAILAKRP
jgi:hypothetical protein